MKYDKLYPQVLSAFVIPRVSRELAEELNVPPGHKSIGIVTATFDDLIFLGLDEATKKSEVISTYVRSMYGGNANASSKLQGEGIGVICGPDISDVRSGMDAFMDYADSHVCHAVSCNEDDSIVSLTCTVSRIGRHFAGDLGIPEGSSIAYMVAHPAETIYCTDEALKASNARMVKFYAPPVETNNGGAIFTGSTSDCEAACKAFEAAMMHLAENPIYKR